MPSFHVSTKISSNSKGVTLSAVDLLTLMRSVSPVDVFRISFKGALQLAIDAEAVKSCLMQFPQISRPDDARPPLHSYTQYVDKEMNAAISLMKVCQSNPDTVVENYLLLMPQSMQNTTQFQRIVELMVCMFVRPCTTSAYRFLCAEHQEGDTDGIAVEVSCPSLEAFGLHFGRKWYGCASIDAGCCWRRRTWDF